MLNEILAGGMNAIHGKGIKFRGLMKPGTAASDRASGFAHTVPTYRAGTRISMLYELRSLALMMK
jgi:transposase